MEKGGFEKICTQPLREKVAYQKFLRGMTDELTINDKTFYWPHRPIESDAKKLN